MTALCQTQHSVRCLLILGSQHTCLPYTLACALPVHCVNSCAAGVTPVWLVLCPVIMSLPVMLVSHQWCGKCESEEWNCSCKPVLAVSLPCTMQQISVHVVHLWDLGSAFIAQRHHSALNPNRHCSGAVLSVPTTTPAEHACHTYTFYFAALAGCRFAALLLPSCFPRSVMACPALRSAGWPA